MNKLLVMLKNVLIFFINILIFMFLRRTLLEHGVLLGIIFSISTLLGILTGVPLYLGLISLDSEVWPIVFLGFDLLTSFLDLEKLKYVGSMYAIALIVFLASDIIVDYQNKRKKIPLQTLKEELKVNSRAVVILMSGAFSLMIKVLIGMQLLLVIMAFLAGTELQDSINMTFFEALIQGIGLLWLDIVLFGIYRFALPSMRECLSTEIAEA